MIMQATMAQFISAGKNFSSVNNTHAVVNGRAATIVKVAKLAEAMSGGVNRVTRSLIEKAINATTGQITA